MGEQTERRCTAFEGCRCVASGDLPEVARKVKQVVDRNEQAAVLVFDDATGEPVELDLRGSAEDVLRRLERTAQAEDPPLDPVPRRGPGRPRLGVVGREVTLLPRHWDWLNRQPGGASVALRRLVEEARRREEGRDVARRVQEATYRFMTALAGDLPGYEEAIRALFAGDPERFQEQIASWPADVRGHAGRLSTGAFPDPVRTGA